MKTTPTPKRRKDRSRFIFLEIASYKRCSRPLCSSQTTTPYHTPHTPKQMHKASQPGNQKQKVPHPAPPPRKKKPQTMVLLSQDPTVCQTQNRLRPAPAVPGHSRASVLGKDKTMRPLFADIPPVSTRRRTSVCATGVTPDKPDTLTYMRHGLCRCSLERR